MTLERVMRKKSRASACEKITEMIRRTQDANAQLRRQNQVN
jgi:hypothetical protein